MPEPPGLRNRLRIQRVARGWSQADLAGRAGISRAAVSAIEGRRLVPSVAAALSLSAALGCTVEEIFGPADGPVEEASWAWPPGRWPSRFWHAELLGQVVLYPVEATNLGVVPHDGVAESPRFPTLDRSLARQTLVAASCDPAIGLLAAALIRSAGVRLVALSRSSRQALELLRDGRSHVAGLHLAGHDAEMGNAAAVRGLLGSGFTLLRIGRWQEGLAVAPGRRIRSVGAAVRSRLSWVGRETGSGARQCLDEILAGRAPPRRVARDHRGVAEAIRSGWADLGVCLRLTSEEAGLSFLPIREEAYDLCFRSDMRHDPRIEALVRVVRSGEFRQLAAGLPGYDVSESGAILEVD